MLIVTAHNEPFKEVAELCNTSIARYCQQHPWARFQSCMIPKDYPRKPSWYKLDVIRRALPDHDYVLWLDADAMITSVNRDLREIIHPATINIAMDCNGINHGVVAYKNCPEAFDALRRMESLYEEFKDDKWFEQSALMTFFDELETFIQPKAIWNAYGEGVTGDSDVCEDTIITHWPGMSAEERIPHMKKALGI